MIIVPFSAEHYRGVNWSQLTEGMILGCKEENWLAWGLKQAERSWGFTALEQGQTMGSAGLWVFERGVGWAWALFTPLARGQGLKVVRLLRRGLADLAVNLGLHRIQTAVSVDFAEARKLVEHLGFEEDKEKGIMHGYGPALADYCIYVRLR